MSDDLKPFPAEEQPDWIKNAKPPAATDTNNTVLTDDEIKAIWDSLPWDQGEVYRDPEGLAKKLRNSHARAIERAVLAKLPGMSAQGWRATLEELRDEAMACAELGSYTEIQEYIERICEHARARIQPAASEAGAVPVAYRYRNGVGSWTLTFDDSRDDAEPLFAAPPSAPAACQHQFHYFGDQVKERRCVRCDVLESKAAPAAESAEPVEVVGIDPLEGEGDGGPHETRLLAQRIPPAATADAQGAAVGLDGLVCEHCGEGHTELTFEDGLFACNCDNCSADCQHFAVERLNALLKPKDAQGDERAREYIDSLDGQLEYLIGRVKTIPNDDMVSLTVINIRERLEKIRAALSRQPSAPASGGGVIPAHCEVLMSLAGEPISLAIIGGERIPNGVRLTVGASVGDWATLRAADCEDLRTRHDSVSEMLKASFQLGCERQMGAANEFWGKHYAKKFDEARTALAAAKTEVRKAAIPDDWVVAAQCLLDDAEDGDEPTLTLTARQIVDAAKPEGGDRG